MIYKVFIHEDIYQELDQIAGYYEEKQYNLGIKFLDHWENSIDQLLKGPLIFQKRSGKFRSIQLSHFPFLVIYEVEDELILIFRIIHAKRNPKKIFIKKI